MFLQQKKGKSETFVLLAPQTNTTHISALFELWIKGSLAFLNFREESDGLFSTLLSCTQPFVEVTSEVWLPICPMFWSYSLLDLYSYGHVYDVTLCTLLICNFCGQLAWLKNKDSRYLYTFSLVCAIYEDEKSSIDKKEIKWKEGKKMKKKPRWNC